MEKKGFLAFEGILMWWFFFFFFEVVVKCNMLFIQSLATYHRIICQRNTIIVQHVLWTCYVYFVIGLFYNVLSLYFICLIKSIEIPT